jgi:hypothetical protein
MIVLYDNNGIPVVNDRGNLHMIDGEDKVRQIIYNVLSTMKGEDLLNPNYGLDIKTLKQTPNISPTVARAIIVDAFNPDNIVGISQLNSVVVTIEGTAIYIDISVTSSDNITVSEQAAVEIQ